MRALTPEELAEDIKKKFKVEEVRIEKKQVGVKKRERVTLWVRGKREMIKDFIKYLMEIEKYPHLAIISGSDVGKNIELIYHFTIYFGRKYNELLINLIVDVPKDNPVVPTVCDLIPGALVTEREKQEMLGIKIEGIPDSRRIFLPEDFPKDIYPWRRDEKGPDRMIRDLYEVKKNES